MGDREVTTQRTYTASEYGRQTSQTQGVNVSTGVNASVNLDHSVCPENENTE